MQRSLTVLVLLTSFSLIGMEARKVTPYASRDDIGRVASLGLERTYETGFAYGHSSFRLGSRIGQDGRREYIRYSIPVFSGDAGLRVVRMLEAFGEVRPSIRAAGAERKRRQKLDRSFTEFFRDHSINDSLYFLYRPGVEISGWKATIGQYSHEYRGAGPIWSNESSRPEFFVRLTPLQIAAMSGDWAAIERLVNRGANPDLVTPDVPQTPLELLITLVQWEQQELGNEHGESPETIELNQRAAEEFVRNEWTRLVENSRSLTRRLSNAGENIVSVLRNPHTAQVIIALLLLYVYWQKTQSSSLQ